MSCETNSRCQLGIKHRDFDPAGEVSIPACVCQVFAIIKQLSCCIANLDESKTLLDDKAATQRPLNTPQDSTLGKKCGIALVIKPFNNVYPRLDTKEMKKYYNP